MVDAKHFKTTLHTVILYTPDMEALANFYAHGLGIGPFKSSPGHLGCQLGAVYFGFDQVEIQQNDAARQSITLWFEVNDLETTFNHLVEMGAEVRYPPTHKPWGAYLAALYDPEGNLVGLSQREVR